MRFLLTLACLVMAPLCQAAVTASDPFPPTHYLTGFGSNDPYRAQSFRVPGNVPVHADSLTVVIGFTNDEDATFHVLLTEADTTGGFHPTKVLFESGPYTAPVFPEEREPRTITVDLGGPLLQPGHDYAWIVDYFADASPAAVVDISVGIGSYAEGVGYRFHVGLFPTGTREEHFASNQWFVQPFDVDWGFQLRFSPVPEPAVAKLLGIALVMLAVARMTSIAKKQRM